MSAADEIRKFKELYDQGALTEEQFLKKKSELLGIKPIVEKTKQNVKPKIESDPPNSSAAFVAFLVIIGAFGIVGLMIFALSSFL